MTDKRLEGLLTLLEPAPFWVNVRSHNEKSYLARLFRDHLWLGVQVGVHVGRLDPPTVFLELPADDLHAERSNVVSGHKFTVILY
jgi:hypothetical protein